MQQAININIKPGSDLYEPGVYDIKSEEYHASNGISRSMLTEFNKTPYHFYKKFIDQVQPQNNKDSKAIFLGSALHTLILEPENFNNEYQIIDKIDRRTKEGKKYFELIELNLGNKKIITQDEFKIISDMNMSLKLNNKIIQLISGGMYERSLYWKDPETEILCKCRPDVWQNEFIVDLKTTSCADYREFQRSLYNYGYHIQCAMIHEAFKHLFNIDMRNFIFVVVENTEPYATAIYQLDEAALDQSVEIFKNKLMELKQCYDKNEWPSYPTQILTLPNYAIGA
jgi:exodeoxyribonuclease VIII